MRNAENSRLNGTKLSADFNFDYYGEFYMKIDNKKARIILAVIIAVSLVISTVYMFAKQGFHEDELLTYNLANSSKQLNVDGGWNSPEDFNEYLAVSPDDRFDYAQVYENQIIDASHPPLYYALVHTVCSFFPGVFSKWLAYSINVLAMAGILIMLYKIGRKITGNNLYALIGVGAYALSIACITTTIYLRMYATLTFWVLAFVYMSIRLYEKKNTVGIKDCILLAVTVLCGVLTQYYFILFAGLTGLVFLVLKIKEKCGKDLIKYIIAAVVGAGLALCIYPYIISNVLGGNRGLSSLDMSALDMVTVVTYVFYKLCTYVQILAKDMFINQVWLLGLCTAAVIGFGIYFRFVKKVKAGDIIVANKNFGCGSSREHAPIAIKASGVSCVIAETFARIFYRNAINIGLPIIECPEAAKAIEAGDEVEVDFDSGIITDKTKNTSYQGQAFPPFMQKIIDCEGLVNYINQK